MTELSSGGKFSRVVVDAHNLPRQIAERLRAQVVQGELRPGERLPSERELAGSLNVSRGVLREAARLLEAAGVLEVRHGLGTFVTQADPQARLLDAVAPRPAASIDRCELVELYQIRRMIEPEAAAIAAARITLEQARELEDLLSRATAAFSAEVDLGLLHALDTRLHAIIAEAAGNQVLVRVMNDLIDLLGESRRFTMRRAGRPRASWAEHRKLVDALVHGRPLAARRAMRAHLDAMISSI